MFLIMSAAFVGQELQTEFGRLPPSFLPLGNKRLYEHQVRLAPENTSIYISIPESYQIQKKDKAWLDANDINVVQIPDNISLGASLVTTLNLVEKDQISELHVLFGDTLFTKIPEGDDIICISDVKNGYNWAVVTNDESNWITSSNLIPTIDDDSQLIVNGYFRFSDYKALIRSITRCNWDFIDGLNSYNLTKKLEIVHSDAWFDFGHVNTFYRSKAKFTTQRAFNNLKITPYWIEKSSHKNEKIAAEAYWFDNLPYKLKHYTPQFLGSEIENGQISYKLEYLYHTALNELYVFGELPINTWKQILTSCISFIEDCIELKAPKNAPNNCLSQLFGDKTISRLKEFCTSNQIDLDKKWIFNQEEEVSITAILSETQKYLLFEINDSFISVLHGDFCFSNILYDYRANKIKTIDPRGMTLDEKKTIYGDIRYDLAKICHSVIGLYDWIIANFYSVSIVDNKIEFEIFESKANKIIQKFLVQLIHEKFGVSEISLLAMQIQLFLSMLPLHSDDKNRQKALFANVFRLYHLIKGLEK